MLGSMALLRPSELARMWELHPKTVYLWIREGKLPAIKTPGAQYRVRSDDARVYCEKHGLPMPRTLASPAGAVAAIGKPRICAHCSARAFNRRCRSVSPDAMGRNPKRQFAKLQSQPTVKFLTHATAIGIFNHG